MLSELRGAVFLNRVSRLHIESKAKEGIRIGRALFIGTLSSAGPCSPEVAMQTSNEWQAGVHSVIAMRSRLIMRVRIPSICHLVYASPCQLSLAPPSINPSARMLSLIFAISAMRQPSMRLTGLGNRYHQQRNSLRSMILSVAPTVLQKVLLSPRALRTRCG